MKEKINQKLRGLGGRILRIIYPFPISKTIYRYLGFNGDFLFNLNGQKISFTNTREEIANDIFYSGIFGNYEGQSLKLWFLLNQKYTGVVLDIGSYTGIFSLVSAATNKNSLIVAFEPHPKSFKLMQKNFNKNNFSNIESFNFALSNYDGTVEFFNDSGAYPSGLTSIKHEHILKDSDSLVCECKDVEEFLETKFNRKIISLVKIDVERGELPILSKCSRRLLENRTIILSEILDYEIYEEFEKIFPKEEYYKILINDKSKQFQFIEDLSQAKKIGRNILFFPSEKKDEILDLLEI